MNKRLHYFLIISSLWYQPIFSQALVDSITESEVKNVINILASDSLRGRGNGSVDLLKAGLFVGNKFTKNGLQYLPGQLNYYLPFQPFGGTAVSDILVWNGKPVSFDRYMFINPIPGDYQPKKLSDFEIIHIDSGFSEQTLKKYNSSAKDLLLWTSEKQKDGNFFLPEYINIPIGGILHCVLLVYTGEKPDSLTLAPVKNYYSGLEYNIVGLLPGRSKANEVIIFSAHYDHEGISPNEKKDSIMNGANDNASGVTAVLMLADYFSMRGDNERTLIFCAFAGEELGLLGSRQIVKLFDAKKIIAVINIEMIGVPQFGSNNIFITGTQYSSLPTLLSKNMKHNNIKIKREPDLKKRLFQRSDNFPFALAGVPAHTIMSSDDNDPCYHKPCDEVKRINISHLTKIIKAIALASESLINGKETPTRVKVDELR